MFVICQKWKQSYFDLRTSVCVGGVLVPLRIICKWGFNPPLSAWILYFERVRSKNLHTNLPERSSKFLRKCSTVQGCCHHFQWNSCEKKFDAMRSQNTRVMGLVCTLQTPRFTLSSRFGTLLWTVPPWPVIGRTSCWSPWMMSSERP